MIYPDNLLRDWVHKTFFSEGAQLAEDAKAMRSVLYDLLERGGHITKADVKKLLG